MVAPGEKETFRSMAQDGADISSPSTMPNGGWGIRGWLSSLYTKFYTLAIDSDGGARADHSQVIFDSSGSVVDFDPPDGVKFGLSSMDWFERQLQMGTAFEYNPNTYVLGNGATQSLGILTPGDTIETWYKIEIESDLACMYEVYNEPTGISGTAAQARSLNPHWQFLGGRDTSTVFYENPSYSVQGPLVKSRAWGTKKSGATIPFGWRILSPDQTLWFDFTNNASTTNNITITITLIEVLNGA